MPISTNTLDTTNLGSAVSIREHLMPGASLVASEQTPVYATLNKVAAKSLRVDFSIDDYSDPVNSAVAEGDDAVEGGDAFGDLGRFFQILQKQRRTFSVTRESQLVDSAADISYNRALAKNTVELNRDTEKMLLSNQARVVGSRSVIRKAAGIAEQLSGSSTIFESEYQAQVVSAATATEEKVNDIIDAIWNESGEVQNLRVYADTAWIKSFTQNAMRLSGTPTNNKLQVNIDGKTGYIPMFIRVFEGSHGMVTMFDTNPKCSLDTTNLDTAYFLNPNYAYIAELGGTYTEELPSKVGNRYGVVERICAPIITNPRACAFYPGLA